MLIKNNFKEISGKTRAQLQTIIPETMSNQMPRNLEESRTEEKESSELFILVRGMFETLIQGA